MAMKQLRRDNTGAGPRRCRSPPIVRTVVEGERRSPGSSSWRSSIRELPSLSQAGTGSRTMAPRGWRQRRKALWSGEAIVTNFEGAEKSDRLEKSSICEIPSLCASEPALSRSLSVRITITSDGLRRRHWRHSLALSSPRRPAYDDAGAQDASHRACCPHPVPWWCCAVHALSPLVSLGGGEPRRR